jgi:hypothetical protein
VRPPSRQEWPGLIEASVRATPPRPWFRKRRATRAESGEAVGSFLVLYQFPGEALSETRNATVHGYVCTALARTASGTVCTGGCT